MRNLYYLTTIRGMPVRLHYTWAIAALLGLAVISGVTIPAFLPGFIAPARVALALVILLLFFGVVVVHEAAHLLIARLFNVRVGATNLYPLGAVTRLPDERAHPRALLAIALAGPLVSIGLWWVLNSIASIGVLPLWIAVVLFVAGELSFYLGVINALPGLPLDGGRVLRSLLMLGGGSFERATRTARIAGQAIAYGLVFLGALGLAGGQDWMRSSAMVLIGWAIREAGGTAHRRALVFGLLHKLTAGEVARPPARTVAPDQTLRSFSLMVQGRGGNEPTAVVADGKFLGMIDRALLRAVPQGYWDDRTIGEAMTPHGELYTIDPTTPVGMIIPHLLGDSDRGTDPERLLPVVRDGRLLGLIDPEEIRSILDLEDEFGLVERDVAAPATAPAPAALKTAAQRGRVEP